MLDWAVRVGGSRWGPGGVPSRRELGVERALEEEELQPLVGMVDERLLERVDPGAGGGEARGV